MITLRNIITTLLKSYNFEVSWQEDYVLAERDDATITIGFLEENKKIRDYVNAIKNIDGKHILVSFRQLSEEERKIIEKNGIVLGDRESVEAEIAETIIHHAGRGRADAGVFKHLIDAIGEESPPINANLEKIPITVEEVHKKGDSIIKPMITINDITEIASKTIRGFKFILELVPYYLFDFSCEFGYKETKVKKNGVIGVNALTSNYELWEESFEVISEIEHAHTKLEPKINEVDALRIAKNKAIALNTTELEKIYEKEYVTIIEKEKIKPEGGINIKGRGLIYLPLWYVEGADGVMIVNAATGKIMREESYALNKKY